jgi:hypothetical protein
VGEIRVREATAEDWPAIWPFLRRIIAAGETFCWDPDTGEAQARAKWVPAPPGRTVVAVDADGRVVGTAETHPNQGGPGAHVANALALWRSLGFEVLATIPEAFDHPTAGLVGLHVMRRRL